MHKRKDLDSKKKKNKLWTVKKLIQRLIQVGNPISSPYIVINEIY